MPQLWSSVGPTELGARPGPPSEIWIFKPQWYEPSQQLVRSEPRTTGRYHKILGQLGVVLLHRPLGPCTLPLGPHYKNKETRKSHRSPELKWRVWKSRNRWTGSTTKPYSNNKQYHCIGSILFQMIAASPHHHSFLGPSLVQNHH